MNEEFENKNEMQPIESSKTDVKAIVKEMFDNGAEKDEIIVALNKMKEEGKLSDEEVAEAVNYVEELTSADREKAEEWFGLKFAE